MDFRFRNLEAGSTIIEGFDGEEDIIFWIGANEEYVNVMGWPIKWKLPLFVGIHSFSKRLRHLLSSLVC